MSQHQMLDKLEWASALARADCERKFAGRDPRFGVRWLDSAFGRFGSTHRQEPLDRHSHAQPDRRDDRAEGLVGEECGRRNKLGVLIGKSASARSVIA